MLIDFNIKEKIKELKRAGKKIPKEYFDLGVAFWLINPDEKQYTPEFLCRKYLHKECDSSTGSELKQLYEIASKKLKEYKLEGLFYDVEMPLIEVLADMELRGIRLEVKILKDLDKELGKKLVRLTKIIYKEAGEAFNINSPKQLSNVLFNKLKIETKGLKKTKGGIFSTDEESLFATKDKHHIVSHLLEYRELFKLQTTYVRPLQNLADKDGRVHTTYVQTGTSTGRLSSQNPNLQNIPVGGPDALSQFLNNEVGVPTLGRERWATELRKAFIPEKGCQLVSFDYSQIELRILASLSGDPKMIGAFNSDLDIHKMTAANVFNVPLEKVAPAMRRLAKTLNFGVTYGMGARAFSKASGLSIAEARRFIDEYFSDFKKIKEWQENIKAQARAFGYVTNLNGRRRWLLEAASMFRGEAAEAERAAINMPVQGLAADIIKMAMIKISQEIKNKKLKDRVKMLLTIHDELLFEIRNDIIKEAVPIICSVMEKVYELEAPIKVDVKIGKNWGELGS